MKKAKKKSEDTLEILDYLQKNIPGMQEDTADEEMEMPEEEEEELALTDRPKKRKSLYK